MRREMPLSRTRLHQILDRFEPGVVMEMVGGYDVGVYFRFRGRTLRRLSPDDRIVGGRLHDDRGFCWESLEMTHAEQFSRGGSGHGIALFFARCEKRKTRFQRWLDQYAATNPKTRTS